MNTVEQKLDRLVDALNAQRVPFDMRLWGFEDIAAYLNCSVSQVRQRFAPLPSFPKAIQLPTATGGKAHPRYKADEVIEWVERYRDAA